jgi:hypothetical protein
MRRLSGYLAAEYYTSNARKTFLFLDITFEFKTLYMCAQLTIII